MNIVVRDKDFRIIDIIDEYESLIWTDRYNEYGDFEIVFYPNSKILKNILVNNYLEIDISEHFMIIESIEIKSDLENGNRLIARGRSFESVLERRIIWDMTEINSSLYEAIGKLLNENLISPVDIRRKIEGIIYRSCEDDYINSISVRKQYTGDNLYEVISRLCKEANIGFKLTFTELEDTKFAFKLYKGEDRTYSQSKNPYVIFSPSFNNLLDSKYVRNIKNLKNSVLIAGEGEGLERKRYHYSNTSGIERRELYVDARDISQNVNGEENISDSDYNILLLYRGLEKLIEYQETVFFDGKIENNSTFKYIQDFNIGDLVQMEDEYGNESILMINEVIISDNKDDGFSVYPSFITESGEL